MSAPTPLEKLDVNAVVNGQVSQYWVDTGVHMTVEQMNEVAERSIVATLNAAIDRINQQQLQIEELKRERTESR